MPIPDPPDGYELLTDYDEEPDPNAVYLDMHTNEWFNRTTLDPYTKANVYAVPVKPPTPPVPYRPFANAEEFKPFCNRWWKSKKDLEDRFYPPISYTPTKHGNRQWADAFKQLEFEDGTPFGVPIEPAERNQ